MTSTLEEKLDRRDYYTPDFNNLKTFENIPVFIYDNLMSNFDDSKYLRKFGAKFLGASKTAVSNFNLLKFTPSNRRKQTYVALTNGSSGSMRKGHVFGDVYAVPPKMMLALDNIYRNGKMFFRRKTTVFLTQQEVKTGNQSVGRPSMPAWMYIGIPHIWENILGLEGAPIWTVPSANKMTQIRNYNRLEPWYLQSPQNRVSEAYDPDEFDGGMMSYWGEWGSDDRDHRVMMH